METYLPRSRDKEYATKNIYYILNINKLNNADIN